MKVVRRLLFARLSVSRRFSLTSVTLTRSIFSWFSKQEIGPASDFLRDLYNNRLLPFEINHTFHAFHGPRLEDADFDSKPMVLLVGQYSTGKTTFIRYLLDSDFPGMRIGPEPTTDRFTVLMNGDEIGTIPGHALAMDKTKPFRSLSKFGSAFLNRIQCSTIPNPVLKDLTIVDTPGVLSGEKQRVDRGYDFTGTLEWFAHRVDRIILLFDAHKLDVSDEFRRCLEALVGNEDKIRIVLNKSDMVNHQELMRVYGALLWSLGKVYKTPEVSRVYIGSFWDHPLHYDINRQLFQDEQRDLFSDLQSLPANSILRKANDLLKRARLASTHAMILSHLKHQTPWVFGKEKKRIELIQNLGEIYKEIQRAHNIPRGDFPDMFKMQTELWKHDFDSFKTLDSRELKNFQSLIYSDIARVLELNKVDVSDQKSSVTGGVFDLTVDSPFADGRGEGIDLGSDESKWVVERDDAMFESLGPVDGFLTARAFKEHVVKWSKLPNFMLSKIWKLADVDQDGKLDAEEFALASYLIELKLEGHDVPATLPKHLIPPSKRGLAQKNTPKSNLREETKETL